MKFEHLDRIVFAGDSVTDMGSTNPVGEGMFDNLGHSYVRIIDNLLASVYPERFIRVTNSGISGNTSRDLLARWERDVLNLNPQWVSICIGINDVWRQFDCPAMPEYACTPEEYRQNLTAMLDSLRGRVKGVFLLTPYYMEPNQTDFMRARMDTYVEICRELAEAYKDLPCTLVDVQAMFDRYFKIRHSSFIAWDRIHPNQIGATLIAREFLSKCDFNYEGEN
jgi:lysophospholipase L1-like esterase